MPKEVLDEPRTPRLPVPQADGLARTVAVDLRVAPVREAHPPRRVLQERDRGGVVQERQEPALALGERLDAPLGVHERRRLAREGGERLHLPGAGGVGRRVDAAQRPDRLSSDHHGCARVEPQSERPRDEGVVGEAWVGGRVGHDERGWFEDRMGAERVPPRRLAKIEPDLRLVPEPLRVDEGKVGHRHVHERRRGEHKVVVLRLGGRVEDLERA